MNHVLQVARRESLRRLKGFELLTKGQIVYFLVAKECEGCEDTDEPIVDPRSFAWLPGVVTEVAFVMDGLLVARVNSTGGIGLYERRFIVTQGEMALLDFPRPKL